MSVDKNDLKKEIEKAVRNSQAVIVDNKEPIIKALIIGTVLGIIITVIGVLNKTRCNETGEKNNGCPCYQKGCHEDSTSCCTDD